MSADKSTETNKSKLWLLFLLLGLAGAGWVGYWVLCLHYFPSSAGGAAERGQFGDMFGGINALFSAFALAGLIYAVVLQRQELALQHEELFETRLALKRTADAQEASGKVLEKQTELLNVSTEMSAWLKAQERWTEKHFTEARGRIFARFHSGSKNWSEQEKEEAEDVCRRIDEFAHLVPFLGEEKVLRIWDDPLAKAWLVLKPVVEAERVKSRWDTKWNRLEMLGEVALEKLIKENRDPRRQQSEL